MGLSRHTLVMMCQYVKVLKRKTFTILDDHLSQRTLTTCLKETQNLHPTEISSKEIITMRAKMEMVTGTAISRNQTLTVARKMATDQETIDLPTTKGNFFQNGGRFFLSATLLKN